MINKVDFTLDRSIAHTPIQPNRDSNWWPPDHEQYVLCP